MVTLQRYGTSAAPPGRDHRCVADAGQAFWEASHMTGFALCCAGRGGVPIFNQPSDLAMVLY